MCTYHHRPGEAPLGLFFETITSVKSTIFFRLLFCDQGSHTFQLHILTSSTSTQSGHDYLSTDSHRLIGTEGKTPGTIPCKKCEREQEAMEHTYKVNDLVLILKKSYEMDKAATILSPTYNEGPYRISEVFNN